MKKKNLKLEDLKVQSFITALTSEDRNTLLGGEGRTDNPSCTAVPACGNTVPALCGSCGVNPQGPQSTCPIILTAVPCV